MFMPPTSWKPPRTVVASPVEKSTRKLKLPYGLSRCVAITAPKVGRELGPGWVRAHSRAGGRGHLADPEDHELGRPGRADADDTDQPALVEVVAGHGRGIAADEEALLGLGAEQGARAPLVEEEALDRVPHAVPQGRAVDL